MSDNADLLERALIAIGALGKPGEATRYSPQQPRVPAGSDAGGEFGPGEPALVERALTALGILDSHRGKDLPVSAWNAGHPLHPKGPDGKWSDTPDGGALDKLKLAGRIKLAPGETLVASGKAAPGTPFALTHTDGGNRLRLGIVQPGDEHQWRGRRLGGTVALDDDGVKQLRDQMPKIAEQAQLYREEMRELADQIDEFDGFKADAADLTPEQRDLMDRYFEWRNGHVFESGVLAEGPDDSLMYEIQGDDGSVDDEHVRVIVGVRSEDDDHDTWDITDGSYLQFDQDEFEAWAKKLAKVLGVAPSAASESGRSNGQPVSRARLREVVACEVRALLRSDVDDDPIGELDDETLALLTAMAELDADAGIEGRAFDPRLHARWPRGSPKAGKFRPMVDLLKMAIANHDGKGHPFENFNREQLRKAAKTRGIPLSRGEDRDSIAHKLLADLSGPPPASPSTPVKKAAKKAAKKAVPAKKAATAGIPGVTLDRIPQIFGDAPDAYRVSHNGTNIGTVHGNEADPNSEWVPFRPTNASWRLRNPGARPSREAAIKELVDSYNASLPRTSSAPHAPTEPAKLLGNLIPDRNRNDNPDRDELHDIVGERLNGQYAGLTVKVSSVETFGGQLGVEADIFDADGRFVGETRRSFRRSHGKLWAYHALLHLEPQVQGQGFAEAWNSHLMKWYTESGLDRIEVTANIDVGGYTWARQGFDWKTKEEAVNIAARLRTQLDEAHPRLYSAEQRAAAESVIERITRLPVDDPDFPTAYEVSQVGRKPGQGKDDSWPGKDAMLGSSWSGVKPVPAAGAAAVS